MFYLFTIRWSFNVSDNYIWLLSHISWGCKLIFRASRSTTTHLNSSYFDRMHLPFLAQFCFSLFVLKEKNDFSLCRPQFDTQDKCKALLCSPFFHSFLKPWHCFEFQCEGFEVDLVQRQRAKNTLQNTWKNSSLTPVQETSLSLWQQRASFKFVANTHSTAKYTNRLQIYKWHYRKVMQWSIFKRTLGTDTLVAAAVVWIWISMASSCFLILQLLSQNHILQARLEYNIINFK